MIKFFQSEKDPKEKNIKFNAFSDEEREEKIELNKIEVNSLTSLIAFVKDPNTSGLFFLPENSIMQKFSFMKL